ANGGIHQPGKYPLRGPIIVRRQREVVILPTWILAKWPLDSIHPAEQRNAHGETKYQAPAIKQSQRVIRCATTIICFDDLAPSRLHADVFDLKVLVPSQYGIHHHGLCPNVALSHPGILIATRALTRGKDRGSRP